MEDLLQVITVGGLPENAGPASTWTSPVMMNWLIPEVTVCILCPL